MWPILQNALEPKEEVKSELLCCRACLGAGRLYNIHRHGLVEAYRQLTGVEVRESSPLPMHLCTWCSCVLLKCVSFRERCRRTEVLLQNLAVLNTVITPDDISRIDRHSQRLLPPHSQSEMHFINCSDKTQDGIQTVPVETVVIKTDTFDDDANIFDDNDDDDDVKCFDVIAAGSFGKKTSVPQEKHAEKEISKPLLKKCQQTNTKRTRSVTSNIKVENANEKPKTTAKPLRPTRRTIKKQSHTPTHSHLSNTKNIKKEIVSIENRENKTKIENNYIDYDRNDNKDDSSDDEPLSEEVKKYEQEKRDVEEFDLIKNNIEEIVLSKDDQIAEILARKDSFNYKNSTYKCDKCFIGYICEDSYKTHMLRHDLTSGAHLCDVCHVRCASAAALRAHAAATHARKYVCKLCGTTLRKLFKAKEHARWHKGFRFNCKMCGESFPRRVMYLKHKRVQHPTEHVCQECGQAYNSRSGLKLHRRKTHKLKLHSEYVCVECGTRFHNEPALKWHAGLALPAGGCDTNLRPCADCGDGFESEQLLRDHTSTVHRNGAVKCHDCNKSFATKSTLAIHQHRVHLGVRLYPEYPRGRRVRGLRGAGGRGAPGGQDADEGPLVFVCEMCGKTCPSKQSLDIHRRTHTNERPYQCQRCPKAFKQKAALNVHQMVHTGAKPYMCPQCGKSFTQSGSMKFHVKTVHLKIPAPYRDRRKKINQ